MTENGERAIDRRSVLKSMATGAAVATGASGLAGAKSEQDSFTMADHRAAVAGYNSPESVQEVVSDHEDALEALASESLVEVTAATDLTLDPQGPKRGVEHERVTSVQRADGSVEPEVKIIRETDEGLLTLGIRPESNERWALLGERDAREPKVLDGVTTLSVCDGGSRCEKDCCEYESCDCIGGCIDWCYDCNC